MAEEDKKDTAPEAPSQDKPVESQTSEPDWSEFVGGKFKSPADVAKAYAELEKQYGKQSEEVKQAREVMQIVMPIIDEIRDDPELFKTVDEKLRSKNAPKDSSKETPTKETAKSEEEQSGVRQVASDLVLAQFEEQHGIDKLDPEDRKDLRQKIGDAIYELTGTNLNGVDLRKLKGTLENAYIIAKYKSTSPDSSEAEDRASMSSVPGSPGKSETTLTPEQASVADKMGLTREQYLEGLKRVAKR